jgi:hypothetical protein
MPHLVKGIMIRKTIFGVIAAAALIAASAGNALAGNQTVIQAIKAQDKVIDASSTYKSVKSFKIDSVTAAKKAIPKYEALQKLLANAATSVAGASATAGQKTGQKDWVSGVRTLSTGIGYLVTELNDAVHNNNAAAKTAARKAEKLIIAGNTIGAKGDKLLGLSTSD